MIWGISCLQFCKKSADHKEGNTCSEVPIQQKQASKVQTNKTGGQPYSDTYPNTVREYSQPMWYFPNL